METNSNIHKSEYTFRGLNFFCRNNFVAEWLNIDPLIPRPLNQFTMGSGKYLSMNHDSESGLPFNENSQKYIYIGIFFQSLPIEKATLFLKECYRILAPGGCLRLVAYDISSHLQMVASAQENLVELIQTVHQTLYLLGYDCIEYNYDLLAGLCQTAGFSREKILASKFQQSQIPEISRLERRSDCPLIFIELEK